MASSSSPGTDAGDESSDFVDPTGLPAGSDYTDVQKGIAWFKLIFGCVFLVIGAAALARFIYVRKAFEIRARSSYLATLNGIGTLGLIGLNSYLAGFVLYDIPISIENRFIVAFFFACLFYGSFWARIVRLAVAFCPRVKRRLPWLLSEKMWVCVALVFATGAAMNAVRLSQTINGPLAAKRFEDAIMKNHFSLNWAVLGISMSLVLTLWRVDDIFNISRELMTIIIIQTLQTVAVYLTDKYGAVQTSYWINIQNIPFTGAVVMFSIIVIDPIRRHLFNPMSKTYPALARAHERRRKNALRALKKNDVSELTEPESFQDAQSGSASATDMPSTSRRKWDYESLAVVPELAAAFRAFAFRALCQESVLFLEEVSKYQRGDFSVCPVDNRSQQNAFLSMVARFIADGSIDEVNISYAHKKTITGLSRNGGETFSALNEAQRMSVFGEVYIDVRYMLETNLLQRFTETQEFQEKARMRRARVDDHDEGEYTGQVHFIGDEGEFSGQVDLQMA